MKTEVDPATTRAANLLYNKRFQDKDAFNDNKLSLGKLRQNVNGGFVIIFDKEPVLPVQRRLCFQFLRGQTQVTLN